jgi:diguanylate cyclase (GGDEF)-like protein
MAILVALCACASFRLSDDAGQVSCIWVSNGLISAFVLTAPRRRKLPLFVTGLLVNIALGLALGDTLGVECWFAVCNAAELLITILPLRQVSCRADLVNQRTICRLAYFGLFLGPLASASLAAPVLWLFQGEPFFQSLRVWFLSDAIGSAASLPLLLLLLTGGRNTRTLASKTGATALVGGLAVMVAFVFGQTTYPIAFLLFPPLAALIFLLRMKGAIIGTSIVVAIAAAFTAEGHGPFALNKAATINTHVILFQTFGLVVFASCFPLGLVLEERNRLQNELKFANRKLRELALCDELTGVLNRRGFDEILESSWSHAIAGDQLLSVIYVDIDFFKGFNDTYGHQSGDDCLHRVAQVLVESVRSSDCVARYGGEEFVIVLPEVLESAARTAAERVASAIRDLKIRHDGSPFGVVTASLGVATICPTEGGSPSQLVHLADGALYTAKRGGRNRIETAVRRKSPESVVA